MCLTQHSFVRTERGERLDANRWCSLHPSSAAASSLGHRGQIFWFSVPEKQEFKWLWDWLMYKNNCTAEETTCLGYTQPKGHDDVFCRLWSKFVLNVGFLRTRKLWRGIRFHVWSMGLPSEGISVYGWKRSWDQYLGEITKKTRNTDGTWGKLATSAMMVFSRIFFI